MTTSCTGRCTHRKKDGSRCRAFARTGKDVCVYHDPEYATQGAEARRRGGLASTAGKGKPATLPPDTPDAPLATVADAVNFIAETLNQTRCGLLSVNVANALFVGAGVLLRALQGSEIESRLNALENRYLGIGTNGRRIA
jgi:hypothetical protein